MRRLAAFAIVAAPAIAHAEPWQDQRHGLTFTLGGGGGVLYHGPWGILLSVLESSKDVQRFATPIPVLDVDVGAWLSPQVALTLHAVGMPFRSAKLQTPTEPATTQTVADVFIGPSLQYWMSPLHGSATAEPSLWIAGAAGVALLANDGKAGLGLELRGGYAMGGGFQIWVEGTEGIFPLGSNSFDMLTVAFLVGYQY